MEDIHEMRMKEINDVTRADSVNNVGLEALRYTNEFRKSHGRAPLK